MHPLRRVHARLPDQRAAAGRSTKRGWTGLWTPVLKMTSGYCEYECSLCSQVCPTHAIAILTLEQKQKIRIGTAFFDRNRCLPYASARTCIVCEEHCPTPEKAIWFEEVSVATPGGQRVTVKHARAFARVIANSAARR